ncbi:GNAT family N-acetyltransferase [Arthrobacter sp. B3I4]|uniref:GNAT family N-acetyltransferase n=1 Tax=Arthrobacter sp. B3I4 TaxID=3042267 RepID=UPI0027852B41|nr:GNAT family N-acetyltransferase [Arthrobacter sp. B3I4]MDQ0755044.1 GNAT superfamily N-acetyltransferase [Arthrobacter sp. B3I4]
MTLTLRPATAADMEAIVRVFLACWRGPYAQVLPSGAIRQMTDERAVQLWSKAFADRTEPDEILVASRGEGSAACAVVRYGLRGSDGQGIIWSLYVDPPAQGAGFGALLLRTAEEALAAKGANSASLCVFARNAPSIAFYGHHGWKAAHQDGETRYEFGEPVLTMTNALSSTGRPGAAVSGANAGPTP